MKRALYIFGEFRLDPAQGLLFRENERVPLPPKPFQALTFLLERRGEVVSKASIMEAVWPDSFVEESSLTQCIFLLRRALGKTATGEEIIETLPKRGYRITLPIEMVERAPGAGDGTGAKVVLEPVQVSEPVQALEPVQVFASTESNLPARSPEDELFATGRGGERVRLGVLIAGAVLVLSASLHAVSRSGLILERPTVLRSTRLTNDGAYKERAISLFTNGERVYFSEDVDAQSLLAEVSTEGGETERHAAPHPIDSALSYSRATNEVLFGSIWEQRPEHRFTAMSLGGNRVRPLGNLSGHAASWSPDGSQIVYARENGLFVALADGSNSREIARTTEPAYWPRWSPDGGRIRFTTRHASVHAGLWEIDADGKNMHPLFAREPWARQACCGDWSSDGRYFVFVLEQAQHSSLWIARDRRPFWQSERATQLAEGPVDFWRAPVVARDGRHLFALGEQARGELMRFDPRLKRFQPYLSGVSTDTISFSRDGQWMAWTAYPEGTLWRSRVDGSARIRLTEPGSIARFPHWSPDGSQIVYISAGLDDRWKVFSTPANGGRPEPLVRDNTNQGVPTWSADGQKIAFGQLVSFGVGQQAENIRILDLKTGATAVVPGSSGLWTARWSPSGEYLSAVTVDNRKLMLYEMQSSTWTELANVGSNDCVWSHDGRYIYFDSPWEATVFRVEVKTRKLERYASLQGMRRTGFFGWTLNLAPDDTPVLLREAGIHEVYSLDLKLP